MAVTKIWPVRGKVDSPLKYVADEEKTASDRWDKSDLQNLTDVMHYAADENKTEKQFYVSGVNCVPDIARDQFVTVKKQFGKEGGIVAYHGYQSFAEGEVTPELAHEIGVEFARRVWGDDYQVLVATHLNTGILHNHFVTNSISFRNGKRLRAKQWYELKEVSDQICREHGLSVVETRNGKGLSHKMYELERSGAGTRLNIAREAIDAALKVSTNLREVEMALRAKGYYVNFNPNRKYWTIKMKDWKKPIRINNMGEDYTNERIMQRLQESSDTKTIIVFQRALVAKRQYSLPTRGHKLRKIGGLKGLYLHYCYLLGYLPRYKKQMTRVSPALRDDVLKLDMISAETKLILREHLDTTDDLATFKESKNEELADKTSKRNELNKMLRRKLPKEELDEIRADVKALNEELRKIRKEIRTAESIEARSVKMQEKIDQVEREEVKEHEHRR